MSIDPDVEAPQLAPPPPERPFADDVDSFDIKFLKANGLLGDQECELSWQWQVDKRGHGIARVRWVPAKRELQIAFEGSYSLVELLPAGRRGQSQMFRCPLDPTVKCTGLFFFDGAIGSRATLGLKYRSIALKPIERKLQTAGKASKLRYQARLPTVISDFPFEKPEPPEPEVESPLRTAMALRLGKKMSTAREEHERKALAAEQMLMAAMANDGSSPLLPVSRLDIAVFENHPWLEIAELYKAGFVVEGGRKTGFGVWDDPRTKLEAAWLCVDLSDAHDPRILVSSAVGDVSAFPPRLILALQHIKLSPINRRYRRNFICPVTGRPVEKLAFRDGRWASMAGQSLITGKQRRPKFLEHDALGARDFVKKGDA